eukprot:TRINITY_DN284_c0_g2_i1.p2 TRINITY_DN284_c0_g2~~TRINITY_DN284_c0_g2_i1.p2  ORF type:complete len:229 (+),score=99.20 TRINITY_DN284_c0_g2_i1:553-1239(+)
MQGSSQDAKVRLLTEDLSKRAATIKKLEEEVRKQTKRADAAEAAAAATRAAPPVAAAAASAATDTKALKDKDAAISELKAELERRSATAHKDAGRAASLESSLQDALRELQVLRQRMVEKEVEITHVRQRLDRAQEAIADSAGAGFESDVKLQRARGALISVLRNADSLSPRSGSPTHTAVSRFCSPGSSGSRRQETVMSPILMCTSPKSPGRSRNVSPQRRVGYYMH